LTVNSDTSASAINVNAGIIEGFFGKPWDWLARLSTTDFLRDWGYQFYVYAPKADPFLRTRWREPMPEETFRHLLELSVRGAANGVSIGVGLTPFEIYLNYDADAQAALRAKVRQINETGVGVLCILFDDMRGDITGLANLQAHVIADICAWSSAQQFIVCPTYYSYDPRLTREFGPPPKQYLRDIGRAIDPQVGIFWTGEKIISDRYPAEHLSDVATELRRKPFIWDNSISNDSKVRTNHLYLDPSARGWGLPVDLVAGIAINPMNQAYLSRIALCGFRRLFGAESSDEAESTMTDCCQRLCGPAFAAQLQEDGRLIQQTGLSKMNADTRLGLLARYEPAVSNPYAQEIAAWLRNDYEFDPQCLTT
jgi:hyaluronoglucosaminidase